MQMTYIRKIVLFFVLVFAFFNLFACEGKEEPTSQQAQSDTQTQTEKVIEFSVHFIDVGTGDCILVRMPDGKNMLIDTGNDKESVYKTVKEFLTSLNVTRIDYLVISNPSAEHVANTPKLTEDFEIGVAYIPKILDTDLFYKFNSAKQSLEQKGVPTHISRAYTKIVHGDCKVLFLSPSDTPDGPYSALNRELSPSAVQIGNVSPIIYCEYKGVRFLFTGDAGKSQEEHVCDLYLNNVYKNAFGNGGIEVDLQEIDFLKVSSHGSEDASTKEFLSLIKPKNAVVSVGGDSSGCPSYLTLKRIIDSREDVNILRTDVNGTVSVYVDVTGEYQTKKQR